MGSLAASCHVQLGCQGNQVCVIQIAYRAQLGPLEFFLNLNVHKIVCHILLESVHLLDGIGKDDGEGHCEQVIREAYYIYINLDHGEKILVCNFVMFREHPI